MFQNSFGFGGSNAHAVLDDAYNYLRVRGLEGRHSTEKLPLSFGASTTHMSKALTNGNHDDNKHSPHHIVEARLLVWSASEKSGLQRLTTTYRAHLATMGFVSDKSKYLADLAYTFSERRSRFAWKSFAVVETINQLWLCLEQGLSIPVRSIRSPKLGFIFTGQDAQWYAMGRGLLKWLAFKDSLLDAGAFFGSLGCTWSLLGFLPFPLGGWTNANFLKDELSRDKYNTNLDAPAYSQPIGTAIQIALVDLLSIWGITPAAVIGHSSGEIAAAYCVGGITRQSALKVAYYRGVVAASLESCDHEHMGMVSIGLSEADIQPHLRQIRREFSSISVACINSPQNVTVSGSEGAIDALRDVLEREGIFARKLNVKVAYHSHYMNEVASIYHILIQNIQAGAPSPGNPVMISTITGNPPDLFDLQTGEYWVNNMISPIKFSRAVKHLSQTTKKLGGQMKDRRGIRVDHLLEIGPHSTLQGPIRECLNMTAKGQGIGYSSILIRDRPAEAAALEAAGTLHCLGFPIKLDEINSPEKQRKPSMLTDLPAYPFNREKKHWLESRLSHDFRFRKFPPHDLLGTPVPDWNPLEPRWRKFISLSEDPWIKDHKVCIHVTVLSSAS